MLLSLSGGISLTDEIRETSIYLEVKNKDNIFSRRGYHSRLIFFVPIYRPQIYFFDTQNEHPKEKEIVKQLEAIKPKEKP